MCVHTQRDQKRGSEPTELELGPCKVPDMSAENLIQILWKNRLCSYLYTTCMPDAYKA